MSFTTENNNENIVKDSAVSEETKSPGRRIAEERAERIRYAAEYRRKLEEEQAAEQQPKKSKAAEQKEKEKLERLAREQEEVREKLEAQRAESEGRLRAAEEKLRELSANAESAAPAIASASIAAVETKADEPEAENNRIIIHIPMQSFNISMPVSQQAASAYVPEMSSYSDIKVAAEASAKASALAMPVTTIVPSVKQEVVAMESKVAAAPVKAEPVPVTQVIDVTSIYRNDALSAPAISYGVVVTEGGWEHEIEDEEDIVIEASDFEPIAEDIFAEVAETEESSVESSEEADSSAAVAGAAVAVAAAGTAAVLGNAKKASEQSSTEPSIPVENPDLPEEAVSQKQEKKAKEKLSKKEKAAEKKRLIEKEDLISIYEQDPVAPKAEEDAIVESAETEPYKLRKSNNKKKRKEKEASDAKPVSVDNGIPFDPRTRPAQESIDAQASGIADYNAHYDKRQIENEHLRYLSETKKLDKIKNKTSNKRYDIKIDENFKKDGKLKKVANSSAAVIKARMEYDSGFGSNDLSIELLKFYDHDFGAGKENKKVKRKMSKIRKSISKAMRLERKATKRYYTVLANEAASPTKLKKVKNQEKLNKLLVQLESLTSERERLDARLKDLYRGAESKAGGKIRARADRKRYKAAKKVHRSLRYANRQLNKLHAPNSLKTKIRYLFNTRIVSKSTLVYSKYLLKKLKPKGDARRELKNDIKKAKKSLFHVGESLNRLLRSARNYDKAHRRTSKLLVAFIILVVLGAALGACWYFFGSTILAMFGLA